MAKILIEKNAYKGYDIIVYPHEDDRPLFVIWVDKIEFTKEAVDMFIGELEQEVGKEIEKEEEKIEKEQKKGGE